jgi:hypothetical protein
VPTRLERTLAELVAGRDGGWSLWSAALAGLELAVQESREFGEPRFASHPAGELRRLLLAIEDALRRGELAVELREAIMADGDTVPEGRHRERIERVLLDRARQAVDERS